MANTPNLRAVACVLLVPGTFVQISVDAPNQIAMFRRLRAQPFLGRQTITGDTENLGSSIQLWPMKL